MSNYIEYNNRIAFHPGYYIKEIIDDSGLTQEDFAKRLDTTPKNLSLLIRGEQSLSVDIAKKLSRMLGTSIKYWLNLQNAYDALLAEFDNERDLEEEREILKCIGYRYFKEYYGLPNLPRRLNEQVAETRSFLRVSSLTVLKKYDMVANFRRSVMETNEASKIKANTMVQIAVNEAIEADAPPFDMKEFEKAVDYALTLTDHHNDFYKLIYDAFLKAGVIFVVLKNIPGSKINGATKKIGNSIMLMVNDRGSYADSFWFTLFHEIGHVMAGDFGVSFEADKGTKEKAADSYARDKLIPAEEYKRFRQTGEYSAKAVIRFANQIGRDPGIVVGRIFNDKKDYSNTELNALRSKYRVVSSRDH